MLKKLQEIYPDLFVQQLDNLSLIDNHVFNTYKWFSLDQNKIIGIPKNTLSNKDLKLLQTFLTPYNSIMPSQTPLEKTWYNRIFNDAPYDLNETFRFVFFQIKRQKHQNFDIETISDFFIEIFPKKIPIIWLNEYEGIIIEIKSLTDEIMNYHHIIDIINADLSMTIKFFVGYFNQHQHQIKNYFNLITKNGREVLKDTNELVIDYFQSIPHLFLKYIDINTKEQIVQTTLQHFSGNSEMLHTLQMFLKYNMNVSETAKQLYMHRNSLQYRIDKFINETNIDIQQFEQAFVLQLALISNKSLNTKN